MFSFRSSQKLTAKNHASPFLSAQYKFGVMPTVSLSPLESVLTPKRVPNSFTCRSYAKRPGWGLKVAQTLLSVLRRRHSKGSPRPCSEHDSSVHTPNRPTASKWHRHFSLCSNEEGSPAGPQPCSDHRHFRFTP